MFARFGVPQIVISDGGTQFISSEFRQFTKEWQFKHIVSSPTHSQSNGMAERHVQVAKNLIKKSIESNKDIHLALLQLRNTPIFGTHSPCEILMSRAARNPLLPYKNNKLKPHVINQRQYQMHLQNNQYKQAKYYNRRKNTKQLSVLKENTRVFIQLKPGTIWYPGTIIKRLSDRRYKVSVDNKGIFDRNRKYLRPSSLKLNNEIKCSSKKQVTWSSKLISEKKEESTCNNYDQVSSSLELPKLELSNHDNSYKENVEINEPSTTTGITDRNRHKIICDSDALCASDDAGNAVKTRYGRLVKPVLRYKV